MKRNVVLVLDADADTDHAVASAATTRNYDLRFGADLKRVFPFLQSDFESVVAIILEIDPGMHAMAILEASDVCENAPAVVVVSALEEHCLGPVEHRRWWWASSGKPLSFTQLGRALNRAVEGHRTPLGVASAKNPEQRAVFKQSPQRINQPKLWNT